MREELSLVEDYRPVALVTGSTSGIGESVARRFVQEGYNVILHSRNSEDKGRSLAAELNLPAIFKPTWPISQRDTFDVIQMLLAYG